MRRNELKKLLTEEYRKLRLRAQGADLQAASGTLNGWTVRIKRWYPTKPGMWGWKWMYGTTAPDGKRYGDWDMQASAIDQIARLMEGESK